MTNPSIEPPVLSEPIPEVPAPIARPQPVSYEPKVDEGTKKIYREIVRYEQQIGDLLSKLSSRDAKISELEKSVSSLHANIGSESTKAMQQLISVVLHHMAMSDARFKNLTEVTLALALKDNSLNISSDVLKEALKDASIKSEMVSKVIAGTKKEAFAPVPVEIKETLPPAILGMKAVFGETSEAGSSQVVLGGKETKENNLHGFRFEVSGVTSQEFRGIEFFVKGEAGTCLRLRLRQTANPEETAEITIDLEDGSYGSYANTNALSMHTLSAKKQANGWWKISFQTLLVAKPEAFELMLLTVGSVGAKSSRHAGVEDRGFWIRQINIQKFAGYTEQAGPATADAQAPALPAAPSTLSVSIKMPPQEQLRQELRTNYLKSGEYNRIASFRNAHAGRRAFILGNGPSIKNQDLTLLKDELTFVTNWFVNHPQYTEINPKYYCVSSHEMFGGWGNPEPAVNNDWYQRMQVKAANANKVFSYKFCNYIKEKSLFPGEKVNYLLFDRPKYQIDQRQDINLDLTQPMDDGYTGILSFCLPLAHFMGITKIYLLGCDCDYGLATPESPKQYFYDFSMHTTSTTSFDGLQRAWAENGPVFNSYEVVRRRFAQDNISIINLTDGGRLEIFPRQRYEDIIAQAPIAKP